MTKLTRGWFEVTPETKPETKPKPAAVDQGPAAASGFDAEANCECKRFESLAELFELCPDFALADVIGDVSKEVSDWVGRKIADRAELNRMATAVWPEGMDMLDAARARIDQTSTPEPKARRRRARFDEFDGDDICLDRLRDGAPFWRTTSRIVSKGPATITVAISQGAPARLSPDAIIWRGIAAIALTEKLEAAGYRVALVGFVMARNAYKCGADSFHSVDLKRHTDPLDVVTLVNSLSGWAFRSIGLGGIALSRTGRKVVPGYGRMIPATAAEFARLYGQPADVLIDAVWDEFAAVDLIEKTLESIDAGTLFAA